MDERIIVKAATSTETVERTSNDTKRNSLLGVLLPLVVPICILIYMLVEEIKFRNLSDSLTILFFSGLFLSVVMFVLHQKAVQLENDKIKEADRIAMAQSLIVTDRRIYGNIRHRSFSYEYSKIIKAYSAQTAGNQAKLIIKLCDGGNLEFQYISNLHTVISCINDAKINYDESILDPVADQVETIVSAIRVDNHTARTDRPTAEIFREDKPEIQQKPKDNVACSDTKVDLYDVVISSAKGSMEQIKVVREITLLALAPAKAIFTSLPYTIAESQEISAAKELQFKLERTGMHVYLVKVSSDV